MVNYGIKFKLCTCTHYCGNIAVNFLSNGLMFLFLFLVYVVFFHKCKKRLLAWIKGGSSQKSRSKPNFDSKFHFHGNFG